MDDTLGQIWLSVSTFNIWSKQHKHSPLIFTIHQNHSHLCLLSLYASSSEKTLLVVSWHSRRLWEILSSLTGWLLTWKSGGSIVKVSSYFFSRYNCESQSWRSHVIIHYHSVLLLKTSTLFHSMFHFNLYSCEAQTKACFTPLYLCFTPICLLSL